MKKIYIAIAVLLSMLSFTNMTQAQKPLAATSKNNTPLKEIMQEQAKLVAQAKAAGQTKATEDNTVTHVDSKPAAKEDGDIQQRVTTADIMATSHFGKNNPAPLHSLLSWTPYNMAVCYEFQLWSGYDSEKSEQKNEQPVLIFSDMYIYANILDIDLTPYQNTNGLAWRVRALNIDRVPISGFSHFEPLYIDGKNPGINYPQPLDNEGKDNNNGSVLLYPVYSFVAVPGAAKYEVELTDREPENPLGTAPSEYRIWDKNFKYTSIYDDDPRMGSHPYFWRVRAFDAEDRPLGTYSPARHFMTDPSVGWQVGVFGDSISHGGGDMSYSPSDLNYSWLHYLSFPAVNLSYSGDTSATLLARFDADVLPFHPHYLLIMGGTNSLRAGVKAESVIEDLQGIKEKCLKNNIKPIFLTLLPINPENIKKCFNESTAADWQENFAKVNDYIRTQVHVDVMAAMPFGPELLPTDMAVEGLHPTALVKRIIGETVSKQWDRVSEEADAEKYEPTETGNSEVDETEN